MDRWKEREREREKKITNLFDALLPVNLGVLGGKVLLVWFLEAGLHGGLVTLLLTLTWGRTQ